MPRCPRPLCGIIAALAVCSFAVSHVLLNLFGLLPLLRTRLSRYRPEHPGPELSYATAFLFRILVLYRWLRRTNEGAPALASLYLRRATREVMREEAEVATAEPLPTLRAGQITPDEFFETYCRKPHPVVIRGLHSLKRDWNVDALIREFGDTELIFNTGESFQRRPLEYLRATDDPDVYVANCEQLLIKNPALLNDLDVGQYRQWNRQFPYCAQIFIGARKRMGLTYHCANNVNVFTMLHGRKRWTFVHPNFSYFMYPWVTRESAYVASIVNHADIEPEHFSLYAYCPRYEVVLEPGDVLFNPPWWWHQVENLDDATVGCATRWTGFANREANNLFSFAQVSSPHLLGAMAKTLCSLLENGSDVREVYRSAPGRNEKSTIIEKVSHTRDQLLNGTAGKFCWNARLAEPS